MFLIQVRFRIRGSEKTFLNKDFPLPNRVPSATDFFKLSILISATLLLKDFKVY